jgi:hypothetical protein
MVKTGIEKERDRAKERVCKPAFCAAPWTQQDYKDISRVQGKKGNGKADEGK